MSKRSILKLLLVCIVVMSYITSNVYAVENEPTEYELLDKVYQLSIAKDYQGAADILHKIIETNPENRNEDVYYKLCDLYDQNLQDYEKACQMYEKYFELFPNGLFYKIYKERYDYLQSNKHEWDALKAYKDIQNKWDKNKASYNIKAGDEFLEKFPNSSLKQDAYFWLANQCVFANKYKQAEKYMAAYFSSIPSDKKLTTEDEIAAAGLYSGIFISLNNFDKAMEYLNKIPNDEPGLKVQYDAKYKFLMKEKRIWRGAQACMAFLVLVLGLILVLRPWKKTGLKFYIQSIKVQVILTLVSTIIPMIILNYMRHGLYRIFPILAVTTTVSLILSKLLLPVSTKLNKPAYFVLNFLTFFAITYLVFFMMDYLYIFWTPISYYKTY